MTPAHVLAAMLEAAAPVVTSYWTDLAHDAKNLADAEPGAVFLWTPREGGSYLIPVTRGDAGNEMAATLWAAMGTPNPAETWRRIEIAGAESTFDPISREDACAACWGALRKAEAGAGFSAAHL